MELRALLRCCCCLVVVLAASCLVLWPAPPAGAAAALASAQYLPRVSSGSGSHEVVHLAAPQQHLAAVDDVPDKCGLCILVLKAVAKLAQQNTTQQAIISYVQNICSYLTQDMIPECDSMVALGTPVLINWLIVEKGPVTLCNDLQLCNATNISPAPKPPPSGNSDNRCPICEFVISTLRGLLANEEMEQEFLQGVSRACAYLPQVDQEPCHELIDNYGSSALAVVMTYASPGYICATLGMCT
jgi:hypothetical protein